MNSYVIAITIGFNVAIALIGFYLAWRIWLFKRALSGAVVALTSWERAIHWALNPERTPELILRGQKATASLRERYARLENQLEQLQRILSIVSIGLRLWQRGGRRRKPLRIR